MSPDGLLTRLRMSFKITYLLAGIAIIVFVIGLYLEYVLDNRSLVLYFLGAEQLYLISRYNEFWRIILAAFVHIDILHLLINVWALWNIGGIIERFYGGKKLLVVYVFTAITASLASLASSLFLLLSSTNENAPYIYSVGASGAIFGMVGLIIGNKFKDDTYSIRMDDYVNTPQLIFYVVYNIMLGVGINVLGGPVNVNNWAHIGGLVGGILIGMYLEPINTYYKNTSKQKIDKILTIGAVVLLMASVIAHLYNIFINYL